MKNEDKGTIDEKIKSNGLNQGPPSRSMKDFEGTGGWGPPIGMGGDVAPTASSDWYEKKSSGGPPIGMGGDVAPTASPGWRNINKRYQK